MQTSWNTHRKLMFFKANFLCNSIRWSDCRFVSSFLCAEARASDRLCDFHRYHGLSNMCIGTHMQCTAHPATYYFQLKSVFSAVSLLFISI